MNSHAWGENRILTFLQDGKKLYSSLYKGDRDVKIPPPRFISCWVSEICNLDCTYCFFSETNHDKSHQYINASRFLAWLQEARDAGAESLEFSGGGEPTLHPDFKMIYECAGSLMGYELGIITHACNDMPVESMMRHFRYIRCGLDAATAETHDLIKRNKRKNYWFHKAIENIKEMVRLRDETANPGLGIGIKIVLNTINVHEVRHMISLARELSVNYIQIKTEHSSDHNLSDDEKQFAQRIIEMEAGCNGTAFTKVLGTLYHQRATVKCFMSPIHTVVTATGKVLQCCFFENRPIGTIFQPFDEVWGSEEHRRVVESTTVEECDKLDCRWNVYNRKMRDIIEDPLHQASFI